MSSHELRSAPSLLPLFGRAALTGPLHRGDSLPESAYALTDQAIVPEHLVSYQHVCGFAVTDVVPPTYLHLLAFPLSVALMSERAFPFPLVGLVHVANSITVTRAVRADDSVSLTVRAAQLRPHAAGRQFDLLAEASVAGEAVWTGRSTYLRRGEPPAGTEKAPRTELAEAAGPSALVRVPENIGRRYGAISGDRNPIHLHTLTARAFGFKTAIAHGMWLQARTLAALQGRLPDSLTVDVAFKRPVPLPSTVALSAVRVDDGWALDVRSRSGQPHLAGSIVTG